MNIHLRVIARMIRVGLFPAVVGALIGIGVHVMTTDQLFYVGMLGLFVCGVGFLYRMTLDDIATEDERNSTSETN